MSILSSTNAGLEGSRKRVEDWLHQWHITNYTLKNLSGEEKSERSIWVQDIKTNHYQIISNLIKS